MRSLANPYEKYKQQGVLAANPVELIIMLYDGCVKQLKLARIAIEEKDYEQVNTSLQKCQNIITELTMSLDFHYPLAKELMKIYEFILDQMRQINTTKETENIEPMIEILNNLRESWTHVLKENKLIENIG